MVMVSYKPQDRQGCSRCGGAAPLSQTSYRGNKGIKRFCCTECEPDILAARKRATERTASWREEKEDLAGYRAAEARAYRAGHQEQYRAYHRQYGEKNKKELAAYRSAYIKANPGFNRAAAARHRATIHQRTVKWADIAAIREFYKACPEGMVVDHIIPLKGKDVSGLHVLNNLQYLTPAENSKKSNHFDERLRA